MKTIRVDGRDYPYGGLGDDRRCIKAGGRILVLFPAVREDGLPINPLPLVGPFEIRRVTAAAPDLAAEHPETVGELFAMRRAYHQGLTREEHVRKYPGDDWITEPEFEEARQRILAESLADFTRTERARSWVWQKHGNKELAQRFGLLSRMQKTLLQQRFRENGLGERAAWIHVYKVQYVALYDDPLQATRLFLYDVREEPDPATAIAAQTKALVECGESKALIENRLAQIIEVLSTHMEGLNALSNKVTEFLGQRAAASGQTLTKRVEANDGTGAPRAPVNQTAESRSCFISYSSKDAEFVERLRKDLEAGGIGCWIDKEDLRIGDKLRVAIDKAICACGSLVLVLSEHSIQSDWVEQEVETALEMAREQKRPVLVPIRLDTTVMAAKTGWPAVIRRSRHIGDCTNWRDPSAYQEAMHHLLSCLAEPCP